MEFQRTILKIIPKKVSMEKTFRKLFFPKENSKKYNSTQKESKRKKSL